MTRCMVFILHILTIYIISCSICVMKGNRHFIVPEADFKLLKVKDHKYADTSAYY